MPMIGNEAAIINNYFRKNHAYRTGNAEFNLNNRALAYVDDDWSEYLSNIHVSQAYGNVRTISEPSETTADNYLDRLTQNYEWVHLKVHSNYLRHYFGPHGDGSQGLAENNEIYETDPVSLFYNLFACSAARYTENNFIANSYLCADTHGLVVLGSSKTGSMNSPRRFYEKIGSGATIGDSFNAWFNRVGIGDIDWYWGMTILGDPTLSINPPPSPLTIRINPGDGGWLVICWDEIPGVDKYLIYRGTSQDGEKELIWSGPETCYIDFSDSQPNTPYYYEFQTWGESSGYSSSSMCLSGITGDLSALPPPPPPPPPPIPHPKPKVPPYEGALTGELLETTNNPHPRTMTSPYENEIRSEVNTGGLVETE